jgi:hypothetical protein
MTLRDLSVAELGRRCREETLRFLHGEPRDDTYCFEVFQRAVVRREDEAWATIVAQYRGIVLAYVGQHSAAAMLREPDDYWVNRAFQRFWSAVGADRFDQFPDLAALLKYLKLCIHSVLMDELRARRAAPTSSLDEVPETAAGPHNAERSVIGKLAGEQLWATIAAELQDESERVVAYLSFTRDLKPSEIYSRHPSLYASIADVYRIKRNLLERLRRNPQVLAFLAV